MNRIISVFLGLLLSSFSAHAVETMVSPLSHPALSAKSRAAALIADSSFNALPHEEMTYIEVGGVGQNQRYNFEDQNGNGSPEEIKEQSNIFSFKHSRGLTEQLALDFAIDYSVRESSARASTGISRGLLGVRSNFTALDMKWIYGGHLVYRPSGESYRNQNQEVAVRAVLGFEERVDIATWGVQWDISTENTMFNSEQSNLIGFFEMPFVNQFYLGLSGGIDVLYFSTDVNRNFANIYGRYGIDKVSSVQANLSMVNEKSYDRSVSQSELGVSFNRVF